MMAAMKTITTSLTGLSSSLLLAVGLARFAQKLDPVSQDRCEWCQDLQSAALTDPCAFPERRGA